MMDETARQLEFLLAPIGEPGSGAVRYAAAMHFYQKRMIGEDVLEIFRICAPNDMLDPIAELSRFGISNPVSTLTKGTSHESR
jgi:hypothetical protein